MMANILLSRKLGGCCWHLELASWFLGLRMPKGAGLHFECGSLSAVWFIIGCSLSARFIIGSWFIIGSRYIETFEMSIFDRWGQLVYSTEDVNKPWDGKIDGTEAPTSVYVFKYKAAGHLFPALEGFGHVTLLRGSDD